MVSRRTPACQYGSRAEFAMIEARQLAPIDTSSPDGAMRLLWHGMQLPDVLKRTFGSACSAMTEGDSDDFESRGALTSDDSRCAAWVSTRPSVIAAVADATITRAKRKRRINAPSTAGRSRRR